MRDRSRYCHAVLKRIGQAFVNLSLGKRSGIGHAVIASIIFIIIITIINSLCPIINIKFSIAHYNVKN